jgi:hypothetical protein
MDVTVLNAAAIAGGALALLPLVLASGGPGIADSAAGSFALFGEVLTLGVLAGGVLMLGAVAALRGTPPPPPA